MKAKRIIAMNYDNHWSLTATVNDLDYQKRFDHEPSHAEVNEAVKSFEDNYAGLNESNNKPVKVKVHHSEG